MFFNKNFGCGCNRQMPQMEEPIMEQPITKCIEKEFHHEVKHCCPIHTHVINKHIYTHKYDEMDAELDYIESNIPIPQKELTAEEALKIITGGE